MQEGAADELEDLRHGGFVAPLAVAGDEARGFAEAGFEFVDARGERFVVFAAFGHLGDAGDAGTDVFLFQRERGGEDGAAGVEELLGAEAADDGVAVVVLVAGVGGVGDVAELVDARGGDGADEPVEVVAVFDEVFGQGLEELGVGGRVALAEVIDGVDQAAAEEVEPDAVDLHAGEHRAVREPIREGEEFVAVAGDLRRLGDAEEAGLGGLIGAGVEEVGLGLDEDGLVALEFVFVALVGAFDAGELVVDAGEEAGPVVIVVLGPALEGVVVALGALELGAEEDAGGAVSADLGVAVGAPPVGRWVFEGAAAGGDDLLGELVEGFVLGDAVADPIVEDAHAVVVELALFDLEEVGPFQGPEVGELGTLEKGVDEPGALVGGGVGDEGLGVGGGRDEAEEVEPGAADEEGVAAQIGGVHAQEAQFLEDLFVDVVVRGRVAPGEVGPRGDEGDGDGDLFAEVADEDGGLAGFFGGDVAIGGDFGDLVVRVVDGEAGDVAGGAVGEFRGDFEADVFGGLDDDVAGDLDVELGDFRGLDAGVGGAGLEPFQEDVVFGGADGEALAALVGEHGCGLEEDEAVPGGEEVDAAAGLVAGQGLPVEIGVLAAEGELKAAFAGGVAVTAAGVAAGLGNDGHDVAPEERGVGGGGRGGGVGGLHGGRGTRDIAEQQAGGEGGAAEDAGEGRAGHVRAGGGCL